MENDIKKTLEEFTTEQLIYAVNETQCDYWATPATLASMEVIRKEVNNRLFPDGEMHLTVVGAACRNHSERSEE